MKAEFRRRLNANYLVIDNEKTVDSDNFEFKMILKNSIPGLLKVNSEMINDDLFILYDISSKCTLEQLIEQKKFDMDLIEAFTASLRLCLNSLDRFMLDPSKLILTEKMIYADIQTLKCSFCYDPFYDGNVREDMKGLFDAIIAGIDYANSSLVKMVYDMHKAVNTDNFNILDMINTAENHINNEEAVFDDIFGLCMDTDEEREDPYIEEEQIFSGDHNETFFSQFKKYFKKNTFKQIVSDLDEGTIMENIRNSHEDTKLSAGYAEGPAAFKGTDNKADIVMDKFPFVIGKLKDNADVILHEPAVSRMHARIHEQNGSYFIEDLNSTNGTYVNGIKVRPYVKERLKSGDVVHFADQKYCFEKQDI